jgi:hypothetical protein
MSAMSWYLDGNEITTKEDAIQLGIIRSEKNECSKNIEARLENARHTKQSLSPKNSNGSYIPTDGCDTYRGRTSQEKIESTSFWSLFNQNCSTSFLTSFFQLIFNGKFACRSVIDGLDRNLSVG